MENCCMEQGDAVLSAPAWQFRMLHLAHRTATDALLDKYGVRDCGHPFILFLLEHCGSDGGFAMQKELSRRLRVSPASVTAARLQRKETLPFLILTPDPAASSGDLPV